MISPEITVSLDTTMLEKIVANLEAEAKKSVEVGWFNTSAHPDVIYKTQDKSTVAGVAYRNEFGVDKNAADKEYGVPPRPFIRPVINVRTRDQQIASLKRTAVAAIKLQDTTGRRRSLGRFLKKALQEAIANGTYLGLHENSEFIERRKGFNFPMRGKTGILRKSIAFRLSNEGVE